MITRFRVEAKANTREECLHSMMNAVESIWADQGTPGADWDCTQEVVVKDVMGEIYRGRIVMKRKEEAAA